MDIQTLSVTIRYMAAIRELEFRKGLYVFHSVLARNPRLGINAGVVAEPGVTAFTVFLPGDKFGVTIDNPAFYDLARIHGLDIGDDLRCFVLGGSPSGALIEPKAYHRLLAGAHDKPADMFDLFTKYGCLLDGCLSMKGGAIFEADKTIHTNLAKESTVLYGDPVSLWEDTCTTFAVLTKLWDLIVDSDTSDIDRALEMFGLTPSHISEGAVVTNDYDLLKMGMPFLGDPTVRPSSCAYPAQRLRLKHIQSRDAFRLRCQEIVRSFIAVNLERHSHVTLDQEVAHGPAIVTRGLVGAAWQRFAVEVATRKDIKRVCAYPPCPKSLDFMKDGAKYCCDKHRLYHHRILKKEVQSR